MRVTTRRRPLAARPARPTAKQSSLVACVSGLWEEVVASDKRPTALRCGAVRSWKKGPRVAHHADARWRCCIVSGPSREFPPPPPASALACLYRQAQMQPCSSAPFSSKARRQGQARGGGGRVACHRQNKRPISCSCLEHPSVETATATAHGDGAHTRSARAITCQRQEAAFVVLVVVVVLVVLVVQRVASGRLLPHRDAPTYAGAVYNRRCSTSQGSPDGRVPGPAGNLPFPRALAIRRILRNDITFCPRSTAGRGARHQPGDEQPSPVSRLQTTMTLSSALGGGVCVLRPTLRAKAYA